MAAKFPADEERLEDVFQEIIKEFARIVDFKQFARSKDGLRLDESNIQHVIEDNPTAVEEQKLQMLYKWKEKNGSEASAFKIRSIVQRFKNPELSKDYVGLTPDIIFYVSDPLSERSSVYRGEQQLITGTRQVAVKLTPYNEKNKREADVLSKLSHHPNVVSLIHSGIYTESLLRKHIFMVMERCRKENLEDFIKLKRKSGISLTESQRLSMAKQFLTGLEFIHYHNIIHRDVKPANVLISEDGRFIKICDYGFCKVLDHGCSVATMTGERVGTDGYRAPETYIKNEISQKSDVFSAGLVVYAISSDGQHAFGKDADRWNSNIKANKNRNLSGILVPKKKPLKFLIKLMLQFHPRKRPAIAEVLLNAIFCQVSTDLQLDGHLRSTGQANALVLFAQNSQHFFSFTPMTKKWNKMQREHVKMQQRFFTIVLGEHIFALKEKKMFRLKYSDPATTWLEMQGPSEEHGFLPPAVALNGAIYVCGGSQVATRLVEKYEFEQWQEVSSMKIRRDWTCLAAAKDSIYCIGGADEKGEWLRSVEMFDVKRGTWIETKPTPRSTFFASAVEKDEVLYVADHLGIQCFNIQKDVWTLMKPVLWTSPPDYTLRYIHFVNNELYAVFGLPGGRGVEIYMLDCRKESMLLVGSRKDITISETRTIALKI